MFHVVGTFLKLINQTLVFAAQVLMLLKGLFRSLAYLLILGLASAFYGKTLLLLHSE
jgi:hypothetical protein